MSLQIRVSALLLQRDQRSAASPPLKSVILPTNRSMSPSSAYVTSYIADKSLRAATSRWGQETMFYIADNTKQIKGYPRGEGFHHSYCRHTKEIPYSRCRLSYIADKQIGISCGSGRRNCFHWETDQSWKPASLLHLFSCANRSKPMGRSGVSSLLNADKEIYEYTL